MTTFIDIHNKNIDEIQKTLRHLRACCGTSLFMDITSSTEIKYEKGFKEWVLLLKNTFSLLALQNKVKNNTIKFIGDEIMIFIPNDVLLSKGYSIFNYYTLLSEIYAAIDILKMLHAGKVHLKCKVAIHYCEEVYNITFFKGYNDYYGKDIDLTSRLISKAKENKIVISESFYQKVLQDLKNQGIAQDSEYMKYVSDKYIEDFKGVPYSTPFRLLNI